MSVVISRTVEGAVFSPNGALIIVAWEQMYISAQSYLNKHLMKMVKSKTEEKLKLVAK
ncbi:MAG: hypothetical protein KME31_37695 [Tolypothrix carrinoi HA7290-LM1]|jgi:hypothetical protein|nr:hypothetical protein [Tolypothrix carrinoi HA7290-LM1]